MTTKISLFIFSLLFSHSDAEITKQDIPSWCSTTPHPVPCRHHLLLLRSKPYDTLISIHDFRTLTIRAALDQAIHVSNLGLFHGCRGKRTKTVYKECNILIEDTIVQLQNTLIRTNTRSDVLTWLSAALTNIHTCRSSSLDLNVTDDFTSGHNLSETISNSLAANRDDYPSAPKPNTRGFPRWVSRVERKMLLRGPSEANATAVVSKDGNGHFRSIQAAVEYAVVSARGGRVVVYVKAGIYEENVSINKTMANVTLVGDGVRHTVITGNRSVSTGFTTYGSATFGVDGPGFIARGIAFRNTAGPESWQAVALRSASDLSVFYACSFEGYQDTLYVQSQRQFYKMCHVYGTVDVIFGNAAVVFQNCVVYVRRPMDGQANVVTAQGRGDPFQNTGISIHRCQVVAGPGVELGSVKTYLGRPWQRYSRTAVMKSYLGDVVAPEGWSPWGDDSDEMALSSLDYGEYENYGPAGGTEKRVKWPGYSGNMSAEEAGRFSVDSLVAGGEWLPATGVPFTAGV